MESGTELAGRYRLEKLLGRGGMGEVWHCHDKRLKRDVAVKVLLATVPDPEEERRFLREAESAAGLRHQGITVVFDIDQHDGRMFIVTELLHGQNLAAVLAGHPGGLPVDQALDIGLEIAAALAYAHAEGIVHRDLKPLNIFIQDNGPMKVCDFGIARDLNATTSITGTGQLIGTPAYIPPEQWEGKPVTHSVDLYALGVTLYEMLTGHRPFLGPGLPAFIHQHLTEKPVPPHTRRPEVPAPLSETVLALLAKTPETRPATAAAVVAALTEIRAGAAHPRTRTSQVASGAPLVQSDTFDTADIAPRIRPRVRPVPAGPLVACAAAGPGAVDIYAADPAGRIRGWTGGPSGSSWGWWTHGNLPLSADGKFSALAAGGTGPGRRFSAVIDGALCVSEGMNGWRRLDSRVQLVDAAVPSAPAGSAGASSGRIIALDEDGRLWVSDVGTPLKAPAGSQLDLITSCLWGRSEHDQVLIAAAGDHIQCRYWWAGAGEYRWRVMGTAPTGRVIADLACASVAARRTEVFLLADNGGLWQSSFRLIHEGVLDWSNWVRVPAPPGTVTAIATCQVDWLHGALVAATSDGVVHFAGYEIDVTHTGLSTWSHWSWVPNS